MLHPMPLGSTSDLRRKRHCSKRDPGSPQWRAARSNHQSQGMPRRQDTLQSRSARSRYPTLNCSMTVQRYIPPSCSQRSRIPLKRGAQGIRPFRMRPGTSACTVRSLRLRRPHPSETRSKMGRLNGRWSCSRSRRCSPGGNSVSSNCVATARTRPRDLGRRFGLLARRGRPIRHRSRTDRVGKRLRSMERWRSWVHCARSSSSRTKDPRIGRNRLQHEAHMLHPTGQSSSRRGWDPSTLGCSILACCSRA